jgi:hypothetical protein
MLRRALLALVVGILVAVVGLAQFDLGSVVGTVKDPSGLAVAGAAVEIRSLATNVTRKAVTSATGDFDFPALQPGRYALTANSRDSKKQLKSLSSP